MVQYHISKLFVQNWYQRKKYGDAGGWRALHIPYDISGTWYRSSTYYTPKKKYSTRQFDASQVPHDGPSLKYVFVFFHPIPYPRVTLALPPSSSSDPGSHSGPSSPLPTTVRAFIFIATKIQHFLPSPTRVELCVYPRC